MVDIGRQKDLLVLYEKEVRRSCGINLSSDPIARVPRISNRNLPSLVQSNIARLQNIQKPVVKKANKELALITKELSKCAVPEPRPITESIGNPFKRKFPEASAADAHKLFAAPPPKRATITLGEYRQRSTFGTFSSSEDSSGAESIEAPSNIVPLHDLNIESSELFGDILTEASEEARVETPSSLVPSLLNSSSNSSLFSVASTQSSDQLPDHLFDDESDPSLQLDIGLDTEEELLRSDTEEAIQIPTQLLIKIDRDRLRFDRFSVERPKQSNLTNPLNVDPINQSPGECRRPSDSVDPANAEVTGDSGSLQRSTSASSYSSISSVERFVSDDSSTTEKEDKGSQTPKRPAQNTAILQRSPKARKLKRYNQTLRKHAIGAIHSLRTEIRIGSIFQRLGVKYADEEEKRLREKLSL